MTVKDEVIEYVRAHPGCTFRDAEHAIKSGSVRIVMIDLAKAEILNRTWGQSDRSRRRVRRFYYEGE